jgi:hypothetical protein
MLSLGEGFSDFQVRSNKGLCPLQRGDNHKNLKMGGGHLKILLLRTMNPEKLNFT